MKKIVCGILAGCLVLATATGCQKNASGKTPITLNEVAHSIFYAPQYAAIELGYFEDEGIDLTLVNGAGADKVMTALVSGDADIGFMGSEASIYTYIQGDEDYAVNFAQLTQRAGNFLVGRTPEADFKWENLIGKKVLGGRAGGMPQMVFEYILKKNGIDPTKDLSIDQSISFGLTAAAFTLIWFFPGDGGTLSELHRLLHGDVDLTFGSSRLLIWRSLLPLIAERPLLGGGCGTLYLRDVPPFYWQRGGETTYFAVTSAHNEYLGVLVDQGALALLAFLALLALALWRAYRHAESDRCAVAGAALLCYAVTAFFSVACCITGVYLWLLLAMLAPKEK